MSRTDESLRGLFERDPSLLSKVMGNGRRPETPLTENALREYLWAIKQEMAINAMTVRKPWQNGLLDSRRSIADECGYPPEADTVSNLGIYKELYDQESIATKVVQRIVKETFQVQPTIYESEDDDVVTPFEEAWDRLGSTIRAEPSWHQDEQGSIVHGNFKRVFTLSRIGSFGVMLLGYDDGRPLDQPLEGVVELAVNRKTGRYVLNHEDYHDPGAPTANSHLSSSTPAGQRPVELTVCPNRAYSYRVAGFAGDRQRWKEVTCNTPGEAKKAADELKRSGYGRVHRTVRAQPAAGYRAYPSMPGPEVSVAPCYRRGSDDGDGDPRLTSMPVLSGWRTFNQRNEDGSPAKAADDVIYDDEPVGGRGWTVNAPRSADSRPFLRGRPSPSFGRPDYGVDRQYDGMDQFGGREEYPHERGLRVTSDSPPQQYVATQLGPSEFPAQRASPSQRKLVFVRCYDEPLVQIVQYEANIHNPRFGQPVMYRITLNDPREIHSGIGLSFATVRVHWSRIVHVPASADDCSSVVFGVPAMRPCLHRLLDLRKLYSGSAEGYWKAGCMPIYSIETHPQLGGDVVLPKAELRDTMENVFNGLQKHIALSGASIKSVGPQIVDPSGQIDKQIEAIAISQDMPKRILMGSERGEQASTQDDDNWNDRKREWQINFITPYIIVPFVDRMILSGVLPEPDDGYSIAWPEVSAVGAEVKANISLVKTQALGAYVQGGIEALMDLKTYLVRVWDMDEEVAKSIADQARDNKQHDMMTIPNYGEPGHPATPHSGGFGEDDDEEQKTDEEQGDDDEEPTGNRADGYWTRLADYELSLARNAFCPTGPGGGRDNSCSSRGAEVAHEAQVAWSTNDQKTLDRVYSRVAEETNRQSLGVVGLKRLARDLGVRGSSAMRKLDLVDAVKSQVQGMKETAPERDRQDRLEHLARAEQGTGVSYDARVVNGILQTTGVASSQPYRAAFADVARNGPDAKREHAAYLKAVRQDAVTSILFGKVPDEHLQHVLVGIAEEGHGRLSVDEYKDRLLGRPHVVLRREQILPDKLKLRPIRS